MKTYKKFLKSITATAVNEMAYKASNIRRSIKKIKKEFPNNPYINDILSDIMKEAELDPSLINEVKIPSSKTKFFINVMLRFWDGVKDDLLNLITSKSKTSKCASLAKLATKAVVVAIFFDVVVAELKSIADGEKCDVDVDVVKSEISKIDDQIKKYN